MTNMRPLVTKTKISGNKVVDVKSEYYKSQRQLLPKERSKVKVKTSRIVSKPYNYELAPEPLDYEKCSTCGGKGRYFKYVGAGRTKLVPCYDCKQSLDCIEVADVLQQLV